jgi:hypothetical protein
VQEDFGNDSILLLWKQGEKEAPLAPEVAHQEAPPEKASFKEVAAL